MSIVKINAITVPADSGDELAMRFAKRAGSVDGFDGFEGFELLRPTDERTTWLVVTRWRDESCFNAWLESRQFGAAHGQPAKDDKGSDSSAHASAKSASTDEKPQKPVGMSAELWSFDVPNLAEMAPSAS